MKWPVMWLDDLNRTISSNLENNLPSHLFMQNIYLTEEGLSTELRSHWKGLQFQWIPATQWGYMYTNESNIGIPLIASCNPSYYEVIIAM